MARRHPSTSLLKFCPPEPGDTQRHMESWCERDIDWSQMNPEKLRTASHSKRLQAEAYKSHLKALRLGR